MGKVQRSFLSPARIVDQYFLEEKNPYSKRRAVHMNVLIGTMSALLVLFIVGVFVFGGTPENRERPAQSDLTISRESALSSVHQGLAVGQVPGWSGKGRSANSSFSGLHVGSGSGAGGRSNQAHSANQVIRRGAGGNDPGASLPLGFTFSVRLVNAIVSSDSPVIAEVTDDVHSQSSLSIPALTRVYGTAQFDESSRRIRVRFQTLVSPEGDEHSIHAIAMMPDGSAGLPGEYHSGEAKRQAGRILGNLISGVADGMKERQGGGQFGMPYEPGSIKNGILGGLSRSAEDQAKVYADDLDGTKPFMTQPAGLPFVLYLERAYVP